MKKMLCFLVAISVLFAACKKDEDSKNYKLSGEVKNLTDRIVHDGTVNLMSGTTIAYTTNINTEGKYAFSDVKEGTYTFQILVSGYNEFTESLPITGDATKNAIITGGSNISGIIIDSQTGNGLANAQIAFTSADAKSGNGVMTDTTLAKADFVFTTDEYGFFEMQGMAYGIYVVVVRATGFTTRVISNITVTSGDFEFPQITLVQQVLEGSLRIILTWGESPSDLDSHLTGPMGDGSRFHMYYVDQAPDGSGVNLDVDDVDSFGPETTTLVTLRNGMYRFSVFNYSDSDIEGGAGIYNSPTSVEIYDYNGLVRSYAPPVFNAGSGNTWRVFEINVTGDTFIITDINTYLYADDDYMEKSQPEGNKTALKFFMKDF